MWPRWSGRSLAPLVLASLLVACAAPTVGPADTPTENPAEGPADGAAGPPDAEAIDELIVAAAADLRPPFEELGRRFEEQHGVPVAFDFGSSGQLAQRIIEGAPVDVFAAANAAFVDAVLAAGQGDPATRSTYGYGRIVLWWDDPSDEGWTSLQDLAADREVTRIAIANPEHAPYGLAAQQALEASGVRDDVQDRLVLGENIADTQRLVETGNADAGIIALSLATAADERGVGGWVLLDEDLHTPLQQDLIVVPDGGARAAAAGGFVDLVEGEIGRKVLRQYGFLLPGGGGEEPGGQAGAIPGTEAGRVAAPRPSAEAVG